AASPVGQVTFAANGVPPAVTGWGVGPEWATVISVQTTLVTVSTERKPVPSPFREYLPLQSNVTTQVSPLMVSVVAIVWPFKLPFSSAVKTPTRRMSCRGEEPTLAGSPGALALKLFAGVMRNA